ncbi:IS66 family insertion sequence element accessory protein TnpA [Pseudoalteromonas luteoviolacea]|uniref:Transposase n=1 Tax=Pseudoalteromonas luteoviolacea NCIMB 1942 TaxID=1365253 RepID=A0A167HB47_9GAMM|nr:hypothetical protein [Pseudoalteromonas luteoviolacea]KZN57926.1 hypothetical protein N482_23045 [Pseudoalteromonas luteoviolacea NCIMB 1942]
MRKMRNLEQWRDIIKQQQASGLTIIEFCQQHALSKTSFYSAKKKLAASSENFVRATVTQHIQHTEQQAPILLMIGKIKISLPPTTSASYLSQLLDELA